MFHVRRDLSNLEFKCTDLDTVCCLIDRCKYGIFSLHQFSSSLGIHVDTLIMESWLHTTNVSFDLFHLCVVLFLMLFHV